MVEKEQKKEQEFNIDEGLAKLEEINRKLAGQDISLNDSIRLYQQGTLLAAECLEHLKGVEQELQIVNE